MFLSIVEQQKKKRKFEYIFNASHAQHARKSIYAHNELMHRLFEFHVTISRRKIPINIDIIHSFQDLSLRIATILPHSPATNAPQA